MKKLSFFSKLIACFSLFLGLISFNSQAQLIFFEDFESGVPGQFSENFVIGTTSWGVNGGQTGGNPFPLNGAISASFLNNANNTDQTELESPTIDMSQGRVDLSFWHVQDVGGGGGGGGANRTLAIFLSTDNGATYIMIDSITNAVNQWQQRTYSLHNFASLTSTCRIKFKATNSGGSRLGLEDVQLFALPPVDAGIIQLNSLSSGCGLSDKEPVRIVIENFGTGPINSGLSVSYSINGGTPFTDAITDTIAFAGVLVHFFNDSADLSMPGNYEIKAWTNLANDGDSSNDTITVNVTSAPIYSSFPYSEDFESGVGSQANFRTSDGVHSLLEVNAAAANGSNFGMYFEGSPLPNNPSNWPGGGGGNTSQADGANAFNTYTDHLGTATVCVDATGITGGLELSFDLRQTWSFGGGYSWFRVLVNGVQISQYYTPQTADADTFFTHTFNLSQFAGTSFEVTFQSVCKYGDPAYTTNVGDKAFVDNINIIQRNDADGGVLAITSPLSNCGLSASEAVTVDIVNYGFGAITSFDVAYKLDTNVTVIETVMDTIAAGDTLSYTFITDSVDLSVLGNYPISAWTNISGDVDLSNDSSSTSIANSKVFSEPYVQDFESLTALDSFRTSVGSEASLTLSIAAANASALGAHFEGGPQPAASWPGGTGGSTTANEAWNVYTDYQASASLCIDATNVMGGLEMSFDLQQTSSIGAGHLYNWFRVLVNGVQVSQDFHPQTQNQDPWQRVSLNLTNYIGGVINVTFQSSCKYSTASGVGSGDNVYIDNINISENNFIDASPNSFLFLNSGCDLSATQSINVNISNFGFATLNNFPISMRVDGGAVVTENVAFPIPGGLQSTHFFSATADLSAPGAHLIEVWTAVPGDTITSNDTLVATIVNYPSQNLPVVEDFEMGPVSINNFRNSTNVQANLSVDTLVGRNNTFGLRMTGSDNPANTGWNGDENTTTAAQAFTENTDFHSYAAFCVDASSLAFGSPLEMFFDARQTFSEGTGYSWLRININGLSVMDLQPTSQDGDAYLRHFIDLSLYSGTSFEVEFQAACRFSDAASPANPGDNAFVDNLIIREPLALNAGVTAIAPSNGCGLGSMESVTAWIENYGTMAISNFDVSYQADGGTIVTETVTTTIDPDSTFAYTFTATADLSVQGPHSIVAYSGLGGDGDASDDTLTVTVINEPSANMFPYVEDFESGTSGIFVQDPGTEHVMSVDGDAANASSFGLLFEGWNNNNTWGAGTPVEDIFAPPIDVRTGRATLCVDATAQTSLELLFDLRMRHSFQQNYAWFRVLVNGNLVSDVNMDSLFQAASADQDPFTRMKFDLTPWVGNKLFVTLEAACKYERGIAGGGQNFPDGDAIHIDNVELRNYLANDVEISAFTSPNTSCGLTATEDVSVTIQNNGSAATTNFPIAYVLNGAAPVLEIITTPIAAGGSLTYTFTNKADLSAVQTHNIRVYASMGLDGDRSNDTLDLAVQNIPLINTFPYSEDFETFNVSANADGYMNGWSTSPGNISAGFRWNVNSGGTPSGGTGPTGNNTTGGVNYLFTEASAPAAQGDEAMVISPCIDLTGLVKPTLNFFYHMFGQGFGGGGPGMGNLYIDIIHPMGITTIDSIIGQQQTANGDPWLQRTVDLTAFAGQEIIVIFRGERGPSNQSDMAIDDVSIADAPAIDLAAVSLVNPKVGCYSSSEAVRVQIKNEGSGTISFASSPAAITANTTGPNPRNYTIPISSGILAVGATMTVVIDTAYDMSAPGTYTFNAVVTITGDGNTSNNIMVPVDRVQTPSFPLPQQVDFSGYNGTNLNTIFPGWNEAQGNMDPSGNTGNWLPNQTAHLAHFGDPNARLVLLSNSANEWIVGPKVIVGSNDSLTFEVAVTQHLGGPAGTINNSDMGSDDFVRLMISTDCGQSWTMMDEFTNADNLDSNMVQQAYSLSAYAGQQISIAFWGSDGAVDDPEAYSFHLDEINIKRPTGSVSNFNLLTPFSGTRVEVSGNQTNTVNNTWEPAFSSIGANDTVRYEYLLDLTGGTFNNPIASFMADGNGADTSLALTYGTLGSMLRGFGIVVGDSIDLDWTVRATADSQVDTTFANMPFTIRFVRGIVSGVDKIELDGYINIYPNPTNGQAYIRYEFFEPTSLNISVYNTIGDVVFEKSARNLSKGQLEIDTENLAAGLYFIELNNGIQKTVKKLMIQK